MAGLIGAGIGSFSKIHNPLNINDFRYINGLSAENPCALYWSRDRDANHEKFLDDEEVPLNPVPGTTAEAAVVLGASPRTPLATFHEIIPSDLQRSSLAEVSEVRPGASKAVSEKS